MSEVGLRAARADDADEQFLWRMLVEAISWRSERKKLKVSEAAADPNLARYVQGWGRKGDTGVIVEATDAPLGAAWWRFFTEEEHGYGFVHSAIPEISMAVVEEIRGRGLGTRLLEALVDRARRDGVPAVSLSVEAENPALRLYERAGFTRVALVDDAWTMRRDIALA